MICNVKCPICSGLLLVGVKYTNEAKTGFADPGFNQPKADLRKGGCACKSSSNITHSNLRHRQLHADLNNDVPLPNTIRYYSSVYKTKGYENGPSSDILASIKSQIKREISEHRAEHDLEQSIRLTMISLPNSLAKTIILRQYLQMNLIHLTVEGGVEVLEDLVGTVVKQERFWKKLNQLQCLHSSGILGTLTTVIERYVRFFQLLKNTESRGHFIPTLDIDLAWRTHQLFQKKYLDDTLRLTGGSVIDHHSKLEEGHLDSAFQYTCKIWRKRFTEDYTFCPCWYCQILTLGFRSKFFWLFWKKKKCIESSTKNGRVDTYQYTCCYSTAVNIGLEFQEQSEVQIQFFGIALG